MFPKYRTSMKDRDWGGMNDRFKYHNLASDEPEEQIVELTKDDDVN